MQTSKTFSLEIEKMAKEKNLTHMDAVVEYCSSKGVEPESVTRLISKSLKDKIEANARDLNYLPNQAKLPI
jgi:hypothetical protein|tara:strand:+ start:221 stop:433 length:213 start_codon:yes stop_codon:yes gene_type:complete